MKLFCYALSLLFLTGISIATDSNSQETEQEKKIAVVKFSVWKRGESLVYYWIGEYGKFNQQYSCTDSKCCMRGCIRKVSEVESMAKQAEAKITGRDTNQPTQVVVFYKLSSGENANKGSLEVPFNFVSVSEKQLTEEDLTAKDVCENGSDFANFGKKNLQPKREVVKAKKCNLNFEISTRERMIKFIVKQSDVIITFPNPLRKNKKKVDNEEVNGQIDKESDDEENDQEELSGINEVIFKELGPETNEDIDQNKPENQVDQQVNMAQIVQGRLI